MTSLKVLPAVIFDTLMLAAEEHGGVGAGSDFKFFDKDLVKLLDDPIPNCIYGLAIWADGGLTNHITESLRENEITRTLRTFGIYRPDSDEYVKTARGFGYPGDRVAFEAWALAGNIVRGDDEHVDLDPAIWP